MNAVVDALSEFGIRHIDMPATPERVWQAIQEAGRKNGARRQHGKLNSPRRPRATSRRTKKKEDQADRAPLLRIAYERDQARGRRVHGPFRQPLPNDAARAAVCGGAGGIRRELYRAWACAHRLQRGVGGDADACRLLHRPHRRAYQSHRRPPLGSRRDRGSGGGRFILGVCRDVRGAGARQHRLSPRRLYAARRTHCAHACDAGVFLPHLRRHGRLGDRAGDAAVHAEPGRDGAAPFSAPRRSVFSRRSFCGKATCRLTAAQRRKPRHADAASLRWTAGGF